MLTTVPGKLAAMALAALLCGLPSLEISSCAAQDDGDADTQAEEKWDQQWSGAIEVRGTQLRVQLQVRRAEDGTYSGHLISLDQGNTKLPLKSFEIDEGKLRFELAAPPTSYEGEFNEDKTDVTGVFKQGGGEFPLVLKVSQGLPILQDKQVWVGTMEAGLKTLRMQFRVVEDEQGNLSAAFDSLSEGVQGITGEYAIDEGQVTFTFAQLLAKYEGQMDEEKQNMTGLWHQSGAKFELNLERKDEPESEEGNLPERPQTPQAPFPYEVEDVRVETKVEDVTLAAMLTRPKGPGPHPAVILVSGSGAQDRDETILGHKPFWVLADSLTRNGIAVLRFDDRGVGESTGNFAAATTADFSQDAEACFDFLRGHDSIDARAIGIMGHSEGGLVAPMVAARRDDLAFIVLLAGPGVDGARISLLQSRLIAQTAGASEEDLDSQEAFLELLIERVLNPDPDEDFETFLNRETDSLIELLPEEQREDEEAVRSLLVAQTRKFDSPWFKFFLTFDPAPTLEQVNCSVLAVIGEKDLQVPAEENIREIRAALERGGNQDFLVTELPGLNHLFQVAETGMPTDYQSIEETFNQDALDFITAWIADRFLTDK